MGKKIPGFIFLLLIGLTLLTVDARIKGSEFTETQVSFLSNTSSVDFAQVESLKTELFGESHVPGPRNNGIDPIEPSENEEDDCSVHRQHDIYSSLAPNLLQDPLTCRFGQFELIVQNKNKLSLFVLQHSWRSFIS